MIKKILLVVCLFLFCRLPAFSQEPPPPCDPDFEVCDETAPLDDGVIILLAAGVLYGLRKHRSGLHP